MTSAITATPEITTTSPATVEPDAEQALASTIARLWGTHTQTKSTAKHTREQLSQIRHELAQHLHALKALLVGTGREGQWAGFLRDQGIPLSSANRLVRRHEAQLNPDKKLLTEQLSEEELVARFVQSVLPRARKVLTTAAAFQGFVEVLAAGIEPAATQETEAGLLVRSV